MSKSTLILLVMFSTYAPAQTCTTAIHNFLVSQSVPTSSWEQDLGYNTVIKQLSNVPFIHTLSAVEFLCAKASDTGPQLCVQDTYHAFQAALTPELFALLCATATESDYKSRRNCLSNQISAAKGVDLFNPVPGVQACANTDTPNSASLIQPALLLQFAALMSLLVSMFL